MDSSFTAECRALSLLVAMLGGCANHAAPSSQKPLQESGDVDEMTQTSEVEQSEAEFKTDEGEPYAIQTPQQSKDVAEAAAADHLDPQRTWRSSPLLPAQWPPTTKEIVVLMYPLAAHPQRMNHFQLYSAAFRVRVSLVDGTAEVEPLRNSRNLGELVEERPTSLERRELDMAETALFRYVAATAEDRGEDSFWGYRKYFHEHPKYARDIARHAPSFVKWLRTQ